MYERAEMIDGLCRIESRLGHGTRVVVEAPRSYS
jgi:signal transduction histidine kinase